MSELKRLDSEYIWHPFDQMKGADILPIVRGEGSYLYDEKGSRYIDAFSSWWVNIHGHSHPYLAKALFEQASQLEHVAFGGFTHPKAVELAERIIKIVPGNLTKVFFSDDGSTSTEIALKMTLQYFFNQGIKRNKFIALKNGYHGDTFGSMCVTARGGFNEPFESQMFDVDYIDAPTQENLPRLLSEMQVFINKGDVAGFIFEPLVQGAGGMLMHDADALSNLIGFCQENGIVCIADEVMTGFGRTGKMFASDYMTSKPDIMCFSKGLTGGALPLGLTVCSQHVFDAFYSDNAKHTFLHGHSYTGNPLACAVACANLDLFEMNDSLDEVQRIAAKLRTFAKEYTGHGRVRAVRTIGGILAIELETGSESSYFNTVGKSVSKYLLAKGIIMRPLGNVLVLIPPYCISNEDLDFIHQSILNYLDSE